MIKFLLFSIFTLIYVLLSHFSLLSGDGNGYVSEIAMGLIKYIITMFIFISGIRYIIIWKKTNSYPLLLNVVELIIIPFTTLVWMFKYGLRELPSQENIILTGFSLIIFYLIYHKDLVEFVGKNMPINEKDKKILFSEYPPKSRIEMIRVDFVMFFVWSLPLIFTIEK